MEAGLARLMMLENFRGASNSAVIEAKINACHKKLANSLWGSLDFQLGMLQNIFLNGSLGTRQVLPLR